MRSSNSLLLEASAGCGKTYAIERLCLKLLEEGISFREIIIVTFTKKGAADLRSRIFGHLKAMKSPFLSDFDEAGIFTIHSFAAKILRENPLGADALLHTLVEEKELFPYIDDFLSDHAPFELFETWKLKSLREALLKGEFEIEGFQEYLKAIKDKHGFFTFDDLLLHLQALVADPSALAGLRARFKVGIIDEFQDTDRVQWEIFSKLFLHEKGRLYLVGDPKQSIYSFRQADIYTYFTAAESVAGQESLSINYRSDPSLIEGLNHLFETPFIALPRQNRWLVVPKVSAPSGKQDRPHIGSWDKIQFFSAQDKTEMFPFIAARILECYQNGVPYGEMAILTDTNELAKDVYAFLQTHRIPSLALHDESEASEAQKALDKVIEAAAHPKDEKKLLTALLTPFFGQTLRNLSLDERELWVSSFMELHEALEKGLQPFLGALFSLTLTTLLSYPFGEAWYRELNRQEVPLDTDTSEPLPPKDKVQILTIHKSKGLEFEVVFPLGLGIRRKKCQDEEQQAEKMRLLYVALTRAKRQLFIPIPTAKKRTDLSSLIEDFFKDSLPSSFKVIPEPLTLPPSPPKPPVRPPPTFTPQIHLKEVVSFTSLKGSSEFLPLSCNLNDLPPGALTGEFVHKLFEKISLPLIQRATSPSDLSNFVRPFTQNTLWDKWQERLCQLLYGAFQVKLDTFYLKDVHEERSFREVEFLHTDPRGYMKGVIDWFFEHNGKYYIVDWKTNCLESYTDESIADCMRRENYVLQAEIYEEAVRRYLKRPCEVGVYFHFVRGAKLWKAI